MGNTPYKRWTKAERARLLELHEAGNSLTATARMLDRPVTTVSTEAKRLGLTFDVVDQFRERVLRQQAKYAESEFDLKMTLNFMAQEFAAKVQQYLDMIDAEGYYTYRKGRGGEEVTYLVDQKNPMTPYERFLITSAYSEAMRMVAKAHEYRSVDNFAKKQQGLIDTLDKIVAHRKATAVDLEANKEPLWAEVQEAKKADTAGTEDSEDSVDNG